MSSEPTSEPSEPSKLKGKWSPVDTAFKVVRQGTVGFDLMTREVRGQGGNGQRTTVLYDSIALRYNQLDPGDLFIVSLPNHPTLGNLRKNLKARGVSEHDYRLFRPVCDETGRLYRGNRRPLALQRLTVKKMTTIQPFPADAARLAKEAEERGTTFNFRQPEFPLKPGPAEDISAGSEIVVNT
jgi:hypothetical protein